MEDIVLIVSMLALFALGFIPVIKWERFIRNRSGRPFTVKGAKRLKRLKRGKRREAIDEAVEEFEANGVLYFDIPCDPAQIDDSDINGMD